MWAIAFGPEVEKLLLDAELPVDDLRNSNKVLLFGDDRAQQISAVVGLERYGSNALIRSLAVAPGGRGTGTGQRLVSFAEDQARAMGVKSLFLLTTTADEFFARLGYQVVSRDTAPPDIAGTPQFSELCPASSVFMVKHLT